MLTVSGKGHGDRHTKRNQLEHEKSDHQDQKEELERGRRCGEGVCIGTASGRAKMGRKHYELVFLFTHLLFARHCAKHFTQIFLPNHCNLIVVCTTNGYHSGYNY